MCQFLYHIKLPKGLRATTARDEETEQMNSKKCLIYLWTDSILSGIFIIKIPKLAVFMK